MSQSKYASQVPIHFVSLVDVSVPHQSSESTLYYYEIDKCKFCACKFKQRLPYDLMLIEREGSNDFITSLDSFKLVQRKTPGTELPENLTAIHDAMVEEQTWRDAICVAGAELDFQTKEKKWVKAKVGWIKSDVIQDVLMLQKRNAFTSSSGWADMKDSFGYYYKESLRLAPAGFYTAKISANQLKSEQNAKHKMEELKQTAKEWKEKIGKKIAFHGNFYNWCKTPFTDPLPIYQSFPIYPNPITLKELQRIHGANLKNDGVEMVLEAYMNVASMATHLEESTLHIETEHEIKQSPFTINKNHKGGITVDAYADIKVYNATFAYLTFGPSENNLRLDLESVDNYFTFQDITLNNPMFTSSKIGSPLSIYTDGSRITMKEVMCSQKLHYLIRKSQWAITHFPKLQKIMFACRMNMDSDFLSQYDEVFSFPLRRGEEALTKQTFPPQMIKDKTGKKMPGTYVFFDPRLVYNKFEYLPRAMTDEWSNYHGVEFECICKEKDPRDHSSDDVKMHSFRCVFSHTLNATYATLHKHSVFKIGFISLYVDLTKATTKNHFRWFSAYSDIKIFGATYARICLPNTDPTHNAKEQTLEMERVDEYFTFPDITMDNPLFSYLNRGVPLSTDGSHLQCKALRFDDNLRKKIQDLNPYYAVTHFPKQNKILLVKKNVENEFMILDNEDVTTLSEDC